MRKKKLKLRNPVARYAKLFNKATVVPDKTKYNRKKDKVVPEDVDSVSYTHLTLPTTPYV